MVNEDFFCPKSTLTGLVTLLTFLDPELFCFLKGSLNEALSLRFYKLVVLAAPTNALRDFLELTSSRIGDFMEAPWGLAVLWTEKSDVLTTGAKVARFW